MRSGIVSALVAAAFLSACTTAASDPGTPLSSDATTGLASTVVPTTATLPIAATGGLVVPECDDEAMCALGFVLDDGIFYNLDCAAISDPFVTDEILGQGQLEDQSVTVKRIDGVDRSLIVAVSLPGGLCTGESDEAPRSNWTAAFPEGADCDALLAAICRVGELSDAQGEANGC